MAAIVCDRQCHHPQRFPHLKDNIRIDSRVHITDAPAAPPSPAVFTKVARFPLPRFRTERRRGCLPDAGAMLPGHSLNLTAKLSIERVQSRCKSAESSPELEVGFDVDGAQL